MKKINIKIDEDTHRALVAFTIWGLNDKESLDLCLAIIMREAAMSQSEVEVYGNLGETSKKLVDKKRKQYAAVDTDAEV